MTANERKALVNECRASGMSAREWCHKKGIAYSTYYGWTKRFPEGTCEETGRSEPKQWLQVKLEDDSSSYSASPKCIEVNCGKWSINIPDNSGFNSMSNVLRAVNELCS